MSERCGVSEVNHAEYLRVDEPWIDAGDLASRFRGDELIVDEETQGLGVFETVRSSELDAKVRHVLLNWVFVLDGEDED